MAEKYQYRDGYFGNRKVAAGDVAAALAAIEATGDLTAERTLVAAKLKDSPLHPQFEWTDKVAAHEHRLRQARQLIRAIVVVRDDEPARSRYVHVPSETKREGAYVRLATVAHEAGEFERALAEAARFLDSAETRFHELRRLGENAGGKIEAMALAAQGFSVVREALALLKVS